MDAKKTYFSNYYQLNKEKYKKKNIEEEKMYQKKYHSRESFKKHRKFLREKNKEKYLATEQRYRDRNRERIRNYMREYQRKNGVEPRKKFFKTNYDTIHFINKNIIIYFN